MSELIDPEQEAKKDTRRAWKFMLAALVLVFGIFVGVMVFYDCPPPDDSGIMPKFTESSGGHNPLAVFLEELKGNTTDGDYMKLSSEARFYERGTEPELKVFLANQTLPLQAFEKLMQTDPATWRWPGGAERVSIHFNSNDAGTCQSIGKLLRMKAHTGASEGEIDEAVQTALKIIAFGSGLERSEGTTLDNLVALTIGALGKKALEQALLCGNADPGYLANIQKEVTRLESRKQDLIMTIKVESLFSKKAIEQVKSSDSNAAVQVNGWWGLASIFLKPNLTQASRIHYLTPAIHGYEMSWKEGWRATQAMNLELEKFSKNLFRFWVSPNAGGNFMTKLSLPTTLTLHSQPILSVTMTRQIDLMLAMRRYELEQGKLPETLEMLVPKYIPSVPVDPFDESPMRWNASKKMIYSVGEDCKDDGGKVDPRRNGRGQTFNKKPDVSMIYWWSDEAKAVRESNM